MDAMASDFIKINRLDEQVLHARAGLFSPPQVVHSCPTSAQTATQAKAPARCLSCIGLAALPQTLLARKTARQQAGHQRQPRAAHEHVALHLIAHLGQILAQLPLAMQVSAHGSIYIF